jgi:hypothetical protein
VEALDVGNLTFFHILLLCALCSAPTIQAMEPSASY